mgnify:CR=1 FL=1
MPRFYYHITDGTRTFTDANGVDLEGIGAARRHLISHIRELRGCLSESGMHNWSELTVVVSNARQEMVQEMGLDFVHKL